MANEKRLYQSVVNKMEQLISEGEYPPGGRLPPERELAERFDLPLVLEFRDRWSEDPYAPPFFWRRWKIRRTEDELIGRAQALVTVSEPWAVDYRARTGKPTTVVYNGYDAEFCGEGPFDGAAGRPGLEIVYTGGIYPGYRDPSPLFAAMKLLDDRGLDCRMIFHGVRPGMVAPLAEAQGVSHLVEVREVLTHEEALRRQRESDILVLLQWNDPKEQGNVPGKFFEYLGARRPILVLGLREGVPATIVKERGAGFFSNDPEEIAGQLTRWLDIKSEKGLLPPVPESGRAGYARDEQYARLEDFLEGLMGDGGSGRTPGPEIAAQGARGVGDRRRIHEGGGGDLPVVDVDRGRFGEPAFEKGQPGAAQLQTAEEAELSRGEADADFFAQFPRARFCRGLLTHYVAARQCQAAPVGVLHHQQPVVMPEGDHGRLRAPGNEAGQPYRPGIEQPERPLYQTFSSRRTGHAVVPGRRCAQSRA